MLLCRCIVILCIPIPVLLCYYSVVVLLSCVFPFLYCFGFVLFSLLCSTVAVALLLHHYSFYSCSYLSLLQCLSTHCCFVLFIAVPVTHCCFVHCCSMFYCCCATVVSWSYGLLLCWHDACIATTVYSYVLYMVLSALTIVVLVAQRPWTARRRRWRTKPRPLTSCAASASSTTNRTASCAPGAARPHITHPHITRPRAHHTPTHHTTTPTHLRVWSLNGCSHVRVLVPLTTLCVFVCACVRTCICVYVCVHLCVTATCPAICRSFQSRTRICVPPCSTRRQQVFWNGGASK